MEPIEVAILRRKGHRPAQEDGSARGRIGGAVPRAIGPFSAAPMLWLRKEHAQERKTPAVLPLSQKLEDGIELARRSVWLASQPAAFVEALLAQASFRQFRRGEVIVELNETVSGLYFLLHGTVDVSRPRMTSELYPVHFLTPNRWFGEHAALTGIGSFAEYRARMASAALYIPRAAIQRLQTESGEFRQSLMELLSFTIRDLMEMVGDMAGLDPGKRVISKLLTLSATGSEDSGEVQAVSISQAELATICCVSRPLINQFLGKLEKTGVLKLEYRRIVILRRAGLIEALNKGLAEE